MLCGGRLTEVLQGARPRSHRENASALRASDRYSGRLLDHHVVQVHVPFSSAFITGTVSGLRSGRDAAVTVGPGRHRRSALPTLPDTPRGLLAIVAAPRDHLRMTTTPLWVPLAVAALGLLGTVVGAISGVLVTQRRADKREVDAWERESEQERERWAREDAARTFEERRDTYISFYHANGEPGRRVHAYLVAR